MRQIVGRPDRASTDFDVPVPTSPALRSFAVVGNDPQSYSGRASSSWCRPAGCWRRSGEQGDAAIGLEQRIGAGPAIDDADDPLA